MLNLPVGGILGNEEHWRKAFSLSIRQVIYIFISLSNALSLLLKTENALLSLMVN